MALWTPEFLQTQLYSAAKVRQALAHSLPLGSLSEGIVDLGDFAVTQRGAGANMSVDVAAGGAWVRGDDTARQGLYHVQNDATVNLAIPAAHASNPRIDQVILRIYDSSVIGGSSDLGAVEVLAGTATSGATLANRTGAAALPASAIRLADVLVPAASTSVVTANIGNPKDPRVGETGYPAGTLSSIAGAPARYAFGRPASYVPQAGASRTGQVLNINTTTAIALTTEEFDSDSMHDLVSQNDRHTIKTPGLYRGLLEVDVSAISGGAFTVLQPVLSDSFRNHFGGVRQAAGGFSSIAAGQCEMLERMAYGDQIIASVYWNGTVGGTTITVTARLRAAWVGP